MLLIDRSLNARLAEDFNLIKEGESAEGWIILKGTLHT